MGYVGRDAALGAARGVRVGGGIARAGGADALPFDARLKLVALQLEFYADAEPLDPRVRTVLDALDAAWCGD